MNAPLMPKATAVWLIENTTLTFDQIAKFCVMHPLEIQGIADGEVAVGIKPENPVLNGQLTADEIERCQADQKAELRLSEAARKFEEIERKKKSRYTPVARRQDKPDAIAWLIKNCPNISDSQIIKLLGTTKSTIASVKNKTHWNSANIRPRDPVLLGLCLQLDLDHLLLKLSKEHNVINEVSKEL